jgi:hypothetical protein
MGLFCPSIVQGFFMPHVFSQSKHPFGQCIHFSQVETFEKP